jgi:hypothetical protein
MTPLTNVQKEINRNLKILYPEALALSEEEFQDKGIKEIVEKIPTYDKPYYNEHNEYYLELALRNMDKDLIKQINKELLEYFPDANLIADVEFVSNKDVAAIENTLKKFDGNFKLLEDLYKVVANRPPFTRLVEYPKIAQVVRELFGFKGNSNKSLINQLIDINYLSTIIHPYEDVYPIRNDIESWIEYCKMIDSAISFINRKFPNWNKMKKAEKNQYIEQLKQYQELDFLEKNDKLDLYIDFLEQYTLHKNGLNAKSAFLLTLNLPKIDTIEIAKDVTKNSQIILDTHLQASYEQDNEANYTNDVESESNQSGYRLPSYN